MTRRSTDRQQIERLVEVVLFGPLDLTIRALEELPEAADKLRRRLQFTRSFGKLAVDRGVAELRRHSDPAGPRPSPASSVTPTPTTAVARAAEDDGPDESGPVAEASELALPDYEQLPAAHVVAKLDGLTPAERDAIEAFESANRNRRTVLGKLDQLRGT